jgi:hypothetical protein
MYLASRGSLPSSTPVARRPDDAPVFAPTKITVPEVSPAKHMVFHKPQHVSPPASSTSKPITGVLQPTSLPRTASSSNIDSTVSKSSSPLAVPPISYAPSTQPATLAVSTAAAAIMPRGTDAVAMKLEAISVTLLHPADIVLIGCSCPSSKKGVPCSILGEKKRKVEFMSQNKINSS